MRFERNKAPAWFSIDNYASLKMATLEDWEIELSNRALCFKSLKAEMKGEKVHPRLLTHAHKTWASIQERALLTKPRQEVEKKYPRLREFAMHIVVDQTRGVIKQTQLAEILARLLTDSNFESVRSFFNGDGAGETLGQSKIFDEWGADRDDYYNGGLERILTVDLSAPDDVLKGAFASWLKAERSDPRHEGVKPHVITKADLDRWTEQRLLPFIDLQFAIDVGHKGMTLLDIGGELFPHELWVALSDRVRKVTRPAATLLMSDRFLRELGRQLRPGDLREADWPDQERPE